MAGALTAPFVMHGARGTMGGGLTHVEQQVKSIFSYRPAHFAPDVTRCGTQCSRGARA